MKRILMVAGILGSVSIANAKDCAVTVESNDAMQFSTKEIKVSEKCKEVAITLKHVGKLPKTAMGHNLVITKKADATKVSTAGMTSGVAGNYLPKDKNGVIAATKLLGGGESDTIKFSLKGMSKGESYVFICTFPGHSTIMRGDFKII